MKKSWSLILLVVSVLALASEARSQTVYSYSDIAYYEPTNSVLAYSEAFPDYSTQLYYCLNVSGPVYKDGAEAGWIYGDNRDPSSADCGGWATADTYLTYDPNAEYDVLASNTLEPRYRIFMNESGDWEDYYNYGAYSSMDPNINFPGSFNFLGPGPSVSGPSNIFLGLVYAIFAGGVASGPPHHLKIVNDQIVFGACAQKMRRITYKIVDAQSNPAAINLPMMEVFPGTIVDSCSNHTVSPSSCRDNYPGAAIGQLTDQILTGCPTSEGNCGFTIDTNKWVWCFPNGITILARVHHDVRYSFISINGDTSPWPPGSEFYP